MMFRSFRRGGLACLVLLCSTATVAVSVGAVVPSPARADAMTPELRTAIDDAKAFVESARGHRFKKDPPVEVLQPKAFTDRLRKVQQADPSYQKDRRELAQLIHALGLMPDRGDPNKLLDALLDSGVAGYYDIKKRVLNVRGGKITPEVKVILVHELTHALDAQYFDLDRPELSKRSDDSAEAFTFVVEGIARMVENQFRSTLSAADTADVQREESQGTNLDKLLPLVTDPTYAHAVPFLLTSLLSPYELGKKFVGDVVAKHGLAGLDTLYTDPPTTTEQATDIRAYETREPAKAVAAPTAAAGGKVVSKGRIGLASLNALLADPTALLGLTIGNPALGWGGDSYVLWTKGSAECIAINTVMDSEKDRAELKTAFTTLSQTVPNASVTDQPGGVVHYQSCSK
jgi:hypothetical protein